tara:strand:- start:456 stop:572 length:117 start_codon:yes stop_codon:yes gene_type:complete
MAHQFAASLNLIPPAGREFIEFIFFVSVGITAGSLGLM